MSDFNIDAIRKKVERGELDEAQKVFTRTMKQAVASMYDDDELFADPFLSMPKEIREWCRNTLLEYIHRYDIECADNLRFADIGDPKQLEAYEKVRENGCCGEGEFQRTGPDGKTYLLGYNYGH